MTLQLPRSPLFWKIFGCIWLAQLTAIFSVALAFWLAHQQAEAHREEHRAHWESGPPDMTRPAPPHPLPGLRLPGGEAGPSHFPPRRPLPWPPLIATFFASLLFAGLLAAYFAKPIRLLRSAFAAVAGGDLTVRVGAAIGSRRDELANLGQDFDLMAGRLGELVDAQRRLLHDVSHEMRSPLARLQLATGLLRQSGKPDPCLLDRIDLECSRIDHLVGELLTLARFESGAIVLENHPVDMRSLIEQVIEDARFEARARQHEIEVSLLGLCVVRGDVGLLHRAFENVLRNALQHTPDNSAIRVESHPVVGGWIRFAVLDCGKGVPESECANIFQPFARCSKAGTGYAGYGLGLAITRQIVLAHSGRISASNRVHGGLCVEILLPCVENTSSVASHD